MPVGLPVTVPAPAPSGVMVSVKVGVKFAVTVVAAETVTVQGPVPVHPAPVQPVKAEPATGVAVSVTTIPIGKPKEHRPGQVIPAGVLVTVPVPAPAIVTKMGGVAEPAVTHFVAALTSSTSAPMSVPSVPAWWKGLEADKRKSPAPASTYPMLASSFGWFDGPKFPAGYWIESIPERTLFVKTSPGAALASAVVPWPPLGPTFLT